MSERITRIDNKYVYEEKAKGNGLASDKSTGIITKDEFERLKLLAEKSLVRKSYVLSESPEVSIKVYGGDYEGLVRAEFEFET